MNVPNILTLLRLLLVPVFLISFFSNSPHNLQIAVAVFFIAGFTDVLDGYIARKYNLVTKFGAVLDPLADKLMLLSVLFCLSFKSYIPFFVFFIILAKEVSMIIVGIFLYNKNVVIPSNIFGKLASVLFYVAILFTFSSPIIGRVLIYIAVLSALVAFFNYIKLYNKKIKG